MARLKKYYQTQLRDELKNKLGLQNIFEVPKIKKIGQTTLLASSSKNFMMRQFLSTGDGRIVFPVSFCVR